MGFKARLNYPDFFKDGSLSLRAYLHQAGFQVYGTVDSANQYFVETVRNLKGQLIGNFEFILAAIWATEDPRAKFIDFCGLSDIGDRERWLGNPDVSPWVVKDGLIVPKKEQTCGDALIVFGEEENFRRKTLDLEQFSIQMPDLIGTRLKPEMDLTINL